MPARSIRLFSVHSLDRAERPRWAAGLFGLLTTLALAAPAQGADVTMPGRYDASSVGQVTTADQGQSGEIRASTSIDAAAGTMGAADAGLDAVAGAGDSRDGKDALLRDANRVSAMLSTSLTNSLRLTLGLHGTYEHVTTADRDALFPESETVTTTDGEAGGWRQDFRQTAFSGASLLIKVKLLERGSTRLGFAPFIESGAGETATWSLTRSVSPKGGAMLLFGYGAHGAADLNLNVGMRYRQPEELGGLTLRNETFYRAALRGWLTPSLTTFLAAEGRKLMVSGAQDRDGDSGERLWRPDEAAGASAGLGFAHKGFEITAYGGRRLAGAKGFGAGDMSWGVGLTAALGNYRGERPKTQYAAEIDAENRTRQAQAVTAAAGKDAAKDAKTAAAPAEPVETYPEMIGADIDPLEAISDADGGDFQGIRQRLNAKQAAAEVESDDAKVTRELGAIRAAEEQADKERAALEKKQAEEQRIKRAKALTEDEALRAEWMREAQKDAAGIEGSAEDDMSWNGLE